MTQAPAKTKIQLYTMMLMQYLLFAVWWVPLAVYLSNIGITGNDKTLILSTMALGSMASPILGALADRYFAAQKVLAISNILTTCLILLSSTISNPQILFVVILLTLFCYIPTWSLTSSIAMRHAPAEEFPRIRMFGTIGWVLSGLFSIAAYQLFDISQFDGSKTPFYCGAIIAALAIPLNFALPNTPPVKSKETFSIKTILGFGAMSLYKDRNYLIFTLASILSIIPFAIFFTFGAQFLSNFDFQYITFTMNLAQVTEIFFLFLATSIILKLGIKTAISIGLATILVRYFLFYLGVVQDMQALFILSILMQGIIFGLLYVGGQVYTDKAAPVQIKAQAQGLLFFMIWGVGLMIANYICGSLISYYQDQPHHGWDSIFLITTLISALPLGLFVLLFKKEKNTPTPSLKLKPNPQLSHTMKKRYILVPAALCFCGGILGSALMIYPAVESAIHDIHVQDNFAGMSPEEQQACAQGILERKCAMCHTSKAKAIPILDSLSGGLLTADIKGAQRSLLLEGCADTRESQIDLLKMNRVLDTKRMPPAQYTIAHWGSFLSDADITALRALYPAEQATAAMYQSIAAAPEPSAEQALKIELGHKLYFDTRLSTDNTISCASCHDLTKGGTDNSEKSAGVFKDGKAQYGGVNAPTVFNAAGHIRQFWDGRAKDLKEQAGGPPLNPVEMGYSSPEDWKLIGDKLARDSQLVALFQSVYGEQGITGDTITDAIAAFEETLCTPNSPFDRYLAGDQNAMSAEQIKGMKTFQDAGCITCHSGSSLGGHSFEYINTFADMRSISPNSQDDGARGRVEFTKDEAHSDMFRVPTLRNVALTGPYFHTGKVEDLEQAVSIMFLTQQSEVVMAEDIENVTKFLQAQTGEYKGKSLDKLTARDVAPSATKTPAVTEAPAAP